MPQDTAGRSDHSAAQPEHGDEQDPFFQQQQRLEEHNGELPPRAPEYGDPLDRPLQDGPADGRSAENGSAEDGTHRG
ncbi:hypothetical protein [Brachybacterium sp.]